MQESKVRFDFERWIEENFPKVSLKRDSLHPYDYCITETQLAWLSWKQANHLYDSRN